MINKKNFIYNIVLNDIKKNKKIKIITRFPPEPNGNLHIGHAKSIFINFNLSKFYKGKCFLRFDDTNPNKEKKKYVKQIQKDIKWLGYKWSENIKYSSDYFNLYYKYAIELINKKLAYIDELNKKEIKKFRGTFKNPGIKSPFRNRTIKENLILFEKMKNGLYKEGEMCLRAKIDMKSKYIILRDPVIYRIKKKIHYKTKKKWNIYPTYDFAHCISDAIEKISHSICTLEFSDNRKLYEWILNNISIKHHPKQYEFSKLNITYTITSKRKIKKLIKNKIINKWNDPRLMTLSGMKKRGYTAKSINKFCNKIGISKQNSNIDISILEECLRKELNKTTPRIMAVINPLKIILTNIDEKKIINIKIPNHPKNKKMGKRNIILSSIIYIDIKDFENENSNNFHKLRLGKKIKLKYAGIIKLKNIIKDINLNILYLKCKYYNIKIKKIKNIGIIHWISKKNIIKSKFRFFNKLFTKKNPNKEKNILSIINPKSIIIKNGYIEKQIKNIKKHKIYQFEREGYFKFKKYKNKKLSFDRIISLKKNYKNN